MCLQTTQEVQKILITRHAFMKMFASEMGQCPTNPSPPIEYAKQTEQVCNYRRLKADRITTGSLSLVCLMCVNSLEMHNFTKREVIHMRSKHTTEGFAQFLWKGSFSRDWWQNTHLSTSRA